MGEEVNDDPEENRALAGYMFELYRELQRDLTQTSVALAKWVLTSLLGINGAAAVATWGIQMPPGPKIAACACYIGGIITALLAAEVSVRLLPRKSSIVAEAATYWLLVKADGERVPSLEGHETRLAVQTQKDQRWPTALGWSAAFFFLSGSAIAGVGGVLYAKDEQMKVVASEQVSSAAAE